MEIVQGWKEGNTIEEIQSILIRRGKPRTERYLLRLFMGVTHQEHTGLKRSDTYIEAKIRYSRRKVDNVFGNEVF